MINSLISGIFKLVSSLVTLILTPLDLAITSLIPDFSSFSLIISQLFAYILQFIGFILDICFIPRDVIGLVCAYLLFKLTVSLFAYPIKLAIKWYKAIKL